MNSEARPNSGILNVNKWKKPGSKQPDLNGRVMTVCVHCQKTTEFAIAAWDRGRFTTLALTEKAEADRKKAEWKAKRRQAAGGDEAEPEREQAAEQPQEGEVPF